MGYRFNAPPNWPAPPSADWLPPQGWTPDAAWGPAPVGWNFWVEDPNVIGQPPVAVPVRVQPARPKSWFAQHKVLTAIGAVLLLGVFSNIASAAGGGTKPVADDSATTQDPAPVGTGTHVAAPAAPSAAPAVKARVPAKPAAKPVAPVAKPPAPVSQLGQVVKDGKFAFKVSAVRCGIAQVGTNSYVMKKAQGQYCRVSLSVQNIGDEAQTMFADNQYLFDSQGRKFSADSTASLYDDSSKLLFEEINPGNAIQGNVYFDVPKGIKLNKLELHDSMFSGGVGVSF